MHSDDAIMVDTVNRVRSLKGGPGIRVVNNIHGITISLERVATIGAVVSSNNSVTVKITGNASGGEKYTGRILTGSSTAVASGTLTMPEGMTVPAADNALILNLAGNGLATHSLSTGTYHVGTRVGALADGTVIVEINSGSLGSVTSPATLGLSTEGTETAATDTWTLTGTTSGTDYGGVPLEIWQTCRVVYNDTGDKKIYAFQRKLTFDTTGRLRSVTAETRVEVDAAGAC